MAKTQEELNVLKKEYETLTTKLQELTEDELKLVTGGTAPPLPATELDISGLFNGCGNLEPTPSLPATPKLGSDNTNPGLVMSKLCDSRSMEEKLLPDK